MFLATLFTVIILCFACECRTLKSINQYNETENYKSDVWSWRGEKNDCWLRVDGNETKMPIPFTTNGNRYAFIYPNGDKDGRPDVKHGHSFKLSCAANGKFASADLERAGGEALVTCLGGDKLLYRTREYRYAEFACDAMPKSDLQLTAENCQTRKYTVAVVGYRTKYKFLELYRLCFDQSAKNSLYTWYDSRTPYFDVHQKSSRPSFIKTKDLYGNLDMNKKYTIAEQRKTVAEILKSQELADKYIRNDNKHSLSRGHYTAKADFFYAFQQSATFYYANVAPQWQLFNGNLWSSLEGLTRHKMDNDTTSSGHLIVTGTYGLCTLPDVDGVQRPLYLDPPSRIPVPLLYWKMYYDFDKEDGMVYLGLNNPYKEIDSTVFICPNVCPDGYDKEDRNEDGDANQGLIYCCTKDAFEKAYGQLDPIVFRRI